MESLEEQKKELQKLSEATEVRNFPTEEDIEDDALLHKISLPLVSY